MQTYLPMIGCYLFSFIVAKIMDVFVSVPPLLNFTMELGYKSITCLVSDLIPNINQATHFCFQKCSTNKQWHYYNRPSQLHQYPVLADISSYHHHWLVVITMQRQVTKILLQQIHQLFFICRYSMYLFKWSVLTIVTMLSLERGRVHRCFIQSFFSLGSGWCHFQNIFGTTYCVNGTQISNDVIALNKFLSRKDIIITIFLN